MVQASELEKTMVVKSMKGPAIEKSASSSRMEVGEIDTRAPFQSVKAAVSLFGDVKKVHKEEKPPVTRKPRLSMDEIILMDKEGELILAQNELGKVKEQLENAEATRTKATSDLEKVNIALQALMTHLKATAESKQLVCEATEALKARVKQLEVDSRRSMEMSAAWQEELDKTTELYKVIVTELDNEKQELTSIRQDFDASLEAKLAAAKQEEEAHIAAEISSQRISELSRDIATMRDSLANVKFPSQQTRQEIEKMMKEKNPLSESHRRAMEELQNKKLSLQEEIDPEITCDLEMMLVETEREIALLQGELQRARAQDMESMRQLTMELEDATEKLKTVAEEECSLRRSVDSLKLELEGVKEHILPLQEKEAERKSVIESLEVELEKCKLELEQEISGEIQATENPKDLLFTLEQITSDSKRAREEAEEIKRTAEIMNEDAQIARNLVEDAEKNLALALIDMEEAKAAEQIALSEIAILSKRANVARASQSMPGEKITLSVEEYESLSKKVEMSEDLAKMKEAAATAQVEAVTASQNELDKKVGAALKEIEDLNAEIEDTTKAAELAEEAKNAIEAELQKWKEDIEESSTSAATDPQQQCLDSDAEPAKGADVA